jgi:autotransporter-associated beta strand protein
MSLGAVAGDTFTIQAADASNVAHNITLSGGLSGVGNLLKTGGGTLTLSGNNYWTGSTTVSAGTLALVGNASTTGVFSDSPAVSILSPGIINVAGVSDDTLHVGDATIEGAESLSGNGTVAGNLYIGTLGSLAPGANSSSFGTFTVTGNLTNAGALTLKIDHPGSGVVNDMIVAQSITNLVGATTTLAVTQGSNSLHTGDVFHLFNIAAGNNPTNLAVALPATSPDTTITYVWNTNNLAGAGTITLTSGLNPVNPIPTNLAFSVSAGVLHLSWPQPTKKLATWALQTNSVGLDSPNDWFTYPGSTTVTNENIVISPTGATYFRVLYYNF